MKGPYLNPFCVMQKYNSGVDAFRGSLGGIHDRSSNPHHFGIQQHWRNRRCTPVSWSLVTFSLSWINTTCLTNLLFRMYQSSSIITYHEPWHHEPWPKESLVSFRHLATVRMSETALALHWLNSRAGLWFITWPYKDLCIHHCNRFTKKTHTHTYTKSSNHAHFSMEWRLEQVADSALRPPDIQNTGDRDNDVKPSSQLPSPHLRGLSWNTWKHPAGILGIVQMIKYTGKHMVNIW